MPVSLCCLPVNLTMINYQILPKYYIFEIYCITKYIIKHLLKVTDVPAMTIIKLSIHMDPLYIYVYMDYDENSFSCNFVCKWPGATRWLQTMCFINF